MKSDLYPDYLNPLLNKPERPLPKEVAIIGAGNIGPDIGYFFKSSFPGIRLVLVDVIEKPLENAKKRIEEYIQKAVDKKKMKPDQAEAVGSNIVYTMDYSEIRNADIVIEAATENLSIKKKIVGQVESLIKKDAIFTSNTSSIPAEKIFSDAKVPNRTTVTHFFYPAWRNPAVEVITWKGVDQEVVDYLRWLFCVSGKVPIVAKSKVCFIFDRIFDNWCNEAALLLDIGTSIEISQIAEEFVFANPFYVLNQGGGNPIVVETNTHQMEEEGEHYKPAHILRSVETWVIPKRGSRVEIEPKLAEKIRNRLLGILFSQSFDIINQGIGIPEDLNLGCQIALGFGKGPFDIMKDLGEKKVKRIITGFQKARPGMPGMKVDYAHYQNFKRHLIVDDMDGVKVITIRRPQVMNVLNDEVNGEILEVLKEYETDPSVKGFVITGYGNRAFCAGAEIGKFPEMLGKAEASAQYSRECSNLLRYLDQCRKPVVAAINGVALGGGFELAIRCHSMVATSNAWFQFPEVSLGILPGIGGMVVPYRKWPQRSDLFHDMIRLANRMTAKEAAEIGIVKSLPDDYDSLIQAAINEVKRLDGKVQRIADGSVRIAPLKAIETPMAGNLCLSKEVVEIITKAIQEAASEASFEKALEIGYKAFGQVACTEAAKEGISAFMEKRSPQFKK